MTWRRGPVPASSAGLSSPVTTRKAPPMPSTTTSATRTITGSAGARPARRGCRRARPGARRRRGARRAWWPASPPRRRRRPAGPLALEAGGAGPFEGGHVLGRAVPPAGRRGGGGAGGRRAVALRGSADAAGRAGTGRLGRGLGLGHRGGAEDRPPRPVAGGVGALAGATGGLAAAGVVLGLRAAGRAVDRRPARRRRVAGRRPLAAGAVGAVAAQQAVGPLAVVLGLGRGVARRGCAGPGCERAERPRARGAGEAGPGRLPGGRAAGTGPSPSSRPTMPLRPSRPGRVAQLAVGTARPPVHGRAEQVVAGTVHGRAEQVVAGLAVAAGRGAVRIVERCVAQRAAGQGAVAQAPGVERPARRRARQALARRRRPRRRRRGPRPAAAAGTTGGGMAGRGGAGTPAGIGPPPPVARPPSASSSGRPWPPAGGSGGVTVRGAATAGLMSAPDSAPAAGTASASAPASAPATAARSSTSRPMPRSPMPRSPPTGDGTTTPPIAEPASATARRAPGPPRPSSTTGSDTSIPARRWASCRAQASSSTCCGRLSGTCAERGAQRVLQARWHVRPLDRGHRHLQDAQQQRGRGVDDAVRGVGRVAHQERVDHRGQRVDVGRRRQPGALQHLGRGVVRDRVVEEGADARRLAELGERHLGEDRPAVAAHQHERRAHPAVDDAGPVGGLERPGERDAHAQDALDVEHAGGQQQALGGRALVAVADDVGPAVVEPAAAVDGDEVGVTTQPRGRLDGRVEPVGGGRVEAAVVHRDRDRATVGVAVGRPECAGRTLPQERETAAVGYRRSSGVASHDEGRI